MHSLLRLGTRGSQLARWQARAVATSLESHGFDVELVLIRTSGDRLQEATLADVGGKRLFVKEIEDALLGGEIDIAVHSAKDLPATLPDGLDVAGTLPREDPRDVLVLPAGLPSGDAASVIARLGGHPRIGTSSVRRVAQLGAAIPGAAFLPIRGNVDTRLRKLDGGEYDALVLAAAGMRRLGFGDRISAALSPAHCVPAPGQGIIAIEIRSDNDRCREAVGRVHDRSAGLALEAERSVVAALGGGCQLPLGALCTARADTLDLLAVVCSPDSGRVLRARHTGRADEPAAVGQLVAEQLAGQGAADILNEVRRNSGPVEGSY